MNILDLIIEEKSNVLMDEVFLDEKSKSQLQQLTKEHQFIDELLKYQLPLDNKILLFGHSGCGKTLTAKALAHLLGKKLMILNLSNIIHSRIGETSKNLKQVFDKAQRENAILFLDEFDQIGKSRGNDENDVGEMRRLVNTIIQLMDYLSEKTLLICATNHPEIIDHALMRRFQLKIEYQKPSKALLDAYYAQLLAHYPTHLQNIERKYDISFAEAKDITLSQVKAHLIQYLENEHFRKQ